jgi:exonuclease SbcC
MKLQTINLKNFGSYAEASIDLSDVAAAVITGPNGAGKSTAFVDAVLWCLFGKCRTETDKMVRLGADDMVVTLSFTLNQQDYRVIRRRSTKTKAGKSDLELQVSQPTLTDPIWTSASGSRLSETQEKICHLLNMDYDLLTSTGFLLQGQADRFSRATPSERKAILAQILRLDRYPRLKQAASAASAVVSNGLSDHRTKLESARLSASECAPLRAQLQTLQADEITWSEELKDTRAGADTDRRTVAELEVQVQELDKIGVLLQEEQQRISTLTTKQTSLVERQLRARKILANRATIEAKVKEEQSLKGVLVLLEQEREALAKDAATFTTALHDVRTKLDDGIQLERECMAAQTEVDRYVTTYLHETILLDTKAQQDRDASELLTHVPCDTDLQKRCQFTIKAIEARERLSGQDLQLAERFTTEDQIAPVAVAARNILRTRYQTFQSLGYDAEAVRLQDSIKEVTEKQADCAARRKAADASLLTLAEFTRLVPELDAAMRELTQIETDLAGVLFDIDAGTTNTLELVERQKRRPTLVMQVQTLKTSLTTRASRELGLTRKLQEVAGQLGGLQERLTVAEQAAATVATMEPQLHELERRLRSYQHLILAYTQIPVLILESAIPLLEEEANRILGKISTSGLRVTVNTQKALKSRDGLAETLDIAVRDVFGERMLENFSGGERARSDLAIRIGLSRLLANRAGAKLETLVVDEAFAAVDREGVEQLVECLPMLNEEFPLILFVTHDENFKSSIAQQILVTKNGSGSMIQVIT